MIVPLYPQITVCVCVCVYVYTLVCVGRVFVGMLQFVMTGCSDDRALQQRWEAKRGAVEKKVGGSGVQQAIRSEEHTSELQSR